MIILCVGHISGVRNSSLNDSSSIANSLHTQFQIWKIIERVKHPKYVHAILDSFVAKFEDHIVRI